MGRSEAADKLHDFLAAHPRLFVLTGAGISTGSGIPDYRDHDGAWKRPPPIQYREFVGRLTARQRYWARSLIGWRSFRNAAPNVCHRTLAAWEEVGRIHQLVTQNVDRLHQSAGSTQVIDLHGRLDRVICLDCGTRTDRSTHQEMLESLNPGFAALSAASGPDGDAELRDADFGNFEVPDCPQCGGLLKPDVVFFGETIPRARVDCAVARLQGADGLLVIGSSLMVYSGYRFCLLANERGMPIAAITPGRTRADPLLTLKVSARFEDVIDHVGWADSPQRAPAVPTP